MVFSSSNITAIHQGLPGLFYFRKQLVAVLLGSVLLVAAARVPVAVHRVLAYPVLLGSIGAMVLVAIPGIGMTVNGNRNWLNFGFFQVQPSEFAKLALLLWGPTCWPASRRPAP